MQSDAVWAEGLLVFYEVFKYLEQAMERDDTLRLYDFEGIRRTQLFEQVGLVLFFVAEIV